MKREKGSIGDIFSAGICMIAMTVLMLAYMDNVWLIHQKTQIGQVARQYILNWTGWALPSWNFPALPWHR